MKKKEAIIRGKDQLGLALRQFRKDAGLTQSELSEQTRILQAHLSKFETGARTPELKTLFQICAVLGLEIVIRKRGSNS